MQERRKSARRRADKELLDRVRQLEAMAERRGAPEGKELQRARRRAIRHTCKVDIDMLIGHAAGFSDEWSVDAIKIEGRLLDLSPGGASLLTRQQFGIGDELLLAIQLRDGSLINTRATVRWVKSVPEKGAYASGVQFGHVSDKDHANIEKFLKELDATAGL